MSLSFVFFLFILLVVLFYLESIFSWFFHFTIEQGGHAPEKFSLENNQINHRVLLNIYKLNIKLINYKLINTKFPSYLV